MYYIYAVYECDGCIEHECLGLADSWKEAIKRIAELYEVDKADGSLGDCYYYASSYETNFYTYF